MNKKTTLAILTCLFLSAVSAYAQTNPDFWQTWRGPDCTGVSPNGNPPVKWSETENIRWKVALTGDNSNSTPIVWDDKIIFQTAVKTDKTGQPETTSQENQAGQVRQRMGISSPTNFYKFNLVCLNRKTGETLWEQTVTEALPHQGHHPDHGFASFSPVTDGKYIWATFGSRGVYCCDMNGKKIWSKELPKLTTMFGEGGSPAIAGDALIVVADHQADSAIFAFDKNTGDILWEKPRDEDTTHATPIPAEVDGKLQVIVSAPNKIRSYDVKNGDVIWECGGMTQNVIPSPVLGNGVIYCTSGFRGSSLMAIKLGRTGDITGSDAILWEVKEATPYVPSPLLYKDRIYVFSVNDEIVSCYNADTGRSNFVKQKLEEMKGVYASPVGAAERIYCVGRNGVTYVLKASDELEVLAVNKLDDPIDCSPVIAGSELYLKGKKHLYCIAESK